MIYLIVTFNVTVDFGNQLSGKKLLNGVKKYSVVFTDHKIKHTLNELDRYNFIE